MHRDWRSLIDTRNTILITNFKIAKPYSCHPNIYENMLPSGGCGSLRLLIDAISLNAGVRKISDERCTGTHLRISTRTVSML